MLPRFRDIAGFLLINWPPSLFHPNFGVFLLDQIADIGVSLSRNLKPWNYFRSIPTYSNQVLCDQRTWTSQTDRQTNSQTDGRQNCVCGMTALCVASCDENRKVATKCFRVESKIPSCRRKTSAHAFRYYPAVYIHYSFRHFHIIYQHDIVICRRSLLQCLRSLLCGCAEKIIHIIVHGFY